MPRITKTTCDICGKEATTYPSFFDFMDNFNYEYMPHQEYLNLRVSTKGCLRDNLYVSLCRDHFDNLVMAIGVWLDMVKPKKADKGEIKDE